MGCDIHFYLEYQNLNNSDFWNSWGERFGMGRNYELFDLLAGVRYQLTPVVQPRGYPENASWETNRDYYFWIADKPDPTSRKVTLHQAASWGTKILYTKDGKPKKCVDPDWHTASWLTYDELMTAVVLAEGVHRTWIKNDKTNPNLNELYKKELNQYMIEYKVMLSTMETFEKAGYKTRAVFWFDN
jgi:hypothetical protein